MALDLCTLPDLKGYLEGMSNVDKYDVLLSSLITMTSKRFESYCGRVWDNNSGNDITEYFDGGGKSFVIVKRIPVASVTSLHDDTARAYGADTLINTTEYVIYNDDGLIELDDGGYFADGRKNVKVVYKGGYTATTIPEDLKLACIMEAAKTFEMRKRLGVESQSNQGGSVVIATTPVGPTQLLPEVRAILNIYRSYRQ